MQEKWLDCSAGSLNVGWNMTDLAVLESVRSVSSRDIVCLCRCHQENMGIRKLCLFNSLLF